MSQQRLLFADRFTAWKQFHADNPQVFELFVKFSFEAVAAGRKHFGARIIGERIRWYVNIETRSTDGLKCNDHVWPYYSRLAMAEHPELAGVFECRDAKFDADVREIQQFHRGIQTAA